MIFKVRASNNMNHCVTNNACLLAQAPDKSGYIFAYGSVLLDVLTLFCINIVPGAMLAQVRSWPRLDTRKQ